MYVCLSISRQRIALISNIVCKIFKIKTCTLNYNQQKKCYYVFFPLQTFLEAKLNLERLCMSVCPFVYLSFLQFVLLSFYLSGCPSVCLSVCSFVSLYFCLAVLLSVCYSVCIYFCLFIPLSICPLASVQFYWVFNLHI